ncbi:MAG: NAD(P)/FAD-dependent oxidoreductase [Bacteroidales bacterium]|nr:NAD(P)/FAD-dependent oxidoreductase [Bacteroidales bacterium]
MESLPNIPVSEHPRIVVVGAGFAGLRLVRKLVRHKYQVVLIDRYNYHQFQPLYYQVATSGLEPSSIVFPLRKLFQHVPDFHFRMAELESVDVEKKEIRTSIGTLGYDTLVLALGGTTNFFGNSEIESKSLSMKSINQALEIRNILLENYEQALNLPQEDEQKRIMNVVVVGGGPTGVELAGAIADMKRFVLPSDYPELDFGRMRVYLLEAADRLLGPMSDFASVKAAKYLKEMGVTIKTGAAVEKYDGSTITLSNGETIASQTVLWAAGLKVPEVPGLEDAPRGRGNRMMVDRFNRLIGYQDIYVLGDQALLCEEAFPNGHPQVAQPAIQQATLLAKNLLRKAKNLPPIAFTYHDKGSMATVGRNKAVVDLGRFHFGGRVAWFIWLLIHLMAIVGTKNRVFIFFNWAWSYITFDQSLRVIIRSNSKN